MDAVNFMRIDRTEKRYASYFGAQYKDMHAN
jgi:hypothetical protein